MRKLVNLFVDRERRQRPARRVSLVELSGLEMLDRRIVPATKGTKFINCRIWPLWHAVWLVI